MIAAGKVAAVASGAADVSQFIITFDSNRFAGAAFGQFDQNLARIEQALGVDLRSKGNQVTVRGPQAQAATARAVLESLYQMASRGLEIAMADVDGAVRMAQAQDDQLNLPAIESRGRLSGAQVSTRKKTVIARTKTQDAYIRALEKNEMVFGVGPAGTGKTYLAVAYAAQLLERGLVQRIILSRPAVEAGERLGFLPGDMKEKVDPYLRPLYDALYDMMPADKVERALTAGVIEIAPLAFMRGRTLAHSAIILDEAQNTTSMQMKMFLTRLGEAGRMIITGDPSQVDLPGNVPSGLVEALRILDGVDGIGVIRFTGEDVVRHPLVQKIVTAYDAADAARAAKG
jgi:phosphate starvation-inducible PhoH-like protein